MLKRFQKAYKDLPNDPQQYVKWVWPENQDWLYQQGIIARQQYEQLMEEGVFVREDYRELVESGGFYMGAQVGNFPR